MLAEPKRRSFWNATVNRIALSSIVCSHTIGGPRETQFDTLLGCDLGNIKLKRKVQTEWSLVSFKYDPWRHTCEMNQLRHEFLLMGAIRQIRKVRNCKYGHDRLGVNSSKTANKGEKERQREKTHTVSCKECTNRTGLSGDNKSKVILKFCDKYWARERDERAFPEKNDYARDFSWGVKFARVLSRDRNDHQALLFVKRETRWRRRSVLKRDSQ